MSARHDFAAGLARLRDENGKPSYEIMYKRIKHEKGVRGSRATFHRMIDRKTDALLAPDYVRGFVLSLGLDEAAAAEWEERRRQVVDAEQRPFVPAVQTSTAHSGRAIARGRRRVVIALVVAAALIACLGASFELGRATAPDSHGPAEAAGPPLGTILGPLDYQAACDRQYGPGRVARPNDQHSAFAWRCVRSATGLSQPSDGVELSIQCLNQYGPRVVARAFSADDPYSWKCVQGL